MRSPGPVTAEVWAEHGIWPQDPGFTRAMAGGVTTMEILPGSANLFGGRGVIIKNVPATHGAGHEVPGAPYTLKMACGENPKRVYGYGNGGIPGRRAVLAHGQRRRLSRSLAEAPPSTSASGTSTTRDFDAWEKKAKSAAPKKDKDDRTRSPAIRPTRPTATSSSTR